jgi:hypothetical protein
MFDFKCPYCGANLHDPRDAPQSRLFLDIAFESRCPKCAKRIYVLEMDYSTLWEFFPVVRWYPVDDGRSSVEHVRLAKSGIMGTNNFRRDDPAIAGWISARRKGNRPCRCSLALISKLHVAREGIPLEFVPPLQFDPWNFFNDCELMTRPDWVDFLPPWDDRDYENHPGDFDVKHGLTHLRKRSALPPPQTGK